MNQKITPIMIIGSAKSGTTTLYNHLVQHPEICKASFKEPEYFTLNREGDNKGKKTGYFEMFDIDFNIHKFIIDASTGYSMCHVEKGVPRRMKEYVLNPYIIYIIRNPFERIRSHYNFNRNNLKWKLKIDSPHLINTSMYFKQIEEYRKVFGEERILLLEFEELKHQPEEVCKRVLHFIGAGEFQLAIHKKVYNKTVPFNRKRAQIMQVLVASKVGKIVPTFIKEGIMGFLNRVLPGEQEYLTNMQKKKIKQALKDDMNNLRAHYKIDISKWGF